MVATMGNGDEEGLQSVVGTRPRYLGLVASEKKAKTLFDYVRQKGGTNEQIALIKCPAGLQLGGETMPEIALSVMAEIIQVRRGIEAKSETAPRSVTFPVMQEAGTTGAGEATDPICGMTVEMQNARYTSVFDDKTFYFCCLRCKETFDRKEL